MSGRAALQPHTAAACGAQMGLGALSVKDEDRRQAASHGIWAADIWWVNCCSFVPDFVSLDARNSR